MRLPFPERVPIGHVAVFAALLFIVQTIDGTALYFSAGCVAFLLIAAIAFNTAGGLTHASGAYVLFYSLLVVVIGVSYKALIGEPGQSNLLDPERDIEVYVGGITAMLAAVIVSRRFARKTGVFQNILKGSQMYRASVGCMLFGGFGIFLIAMLGQSGARLGSAFAQLNQLMPLGIIIGVMYEIRRSGGTRSLNTPVLIGAAYYFFIFGLLGFSKQGMLFPIFCWALPVCSSRFRLSPLQVVYALGAMFIVFYYLVPYAQYGRRFTSDNPGTAERFSIAERLLGSPNETRKNYEEVDLGGGLDQYYNRPEGFWDRLQFVSVDDKLNNVTDQGRVFGLSPIWDSFFNAVPHVIWPNKPSINFGNAYAHEVGNMPAEDTSTGISFSPTAEAFHMARWVGLFVVAPLVWAVLFIVLDSLFGDLRATPWGLLTLAMVSHVAPEGALSGGIYLLTFGVEILSFCALFATYVAPILAVLALGPERRLVEGGMVRRSTMRETRILDALRRQEESRDQQSLFQNE